MTALQDWLSSGPINPAGIRDVIRDAWRELTSDDREPAAEPQLMGRGLERC